MTEEQKTKKTRRKKGETNFSAEKHYFKVDKKILNIASTKDLSKSELLVYLQHCRASNPDKNMSCSFAGVNIVKKNLGLLKEETDKATKKLIAKHLIKLRTDVKNGYLKSVPIEVLAFPEYTPPADEQSEGSFMPNATNKNQHRSYEQGTYINLPSTLIDERALKDLKRQSIFALIALYGEVRWLDYWGVNYYKIHKVSSQNEKGFIKGRDFGKGFSINIYGKASAEVIEPDSLYVSEHFKFIQGNLEDAINELEEKRIFIFKPVLTEKFEDEEIIRLKMQIHQGLVKFSNSEDKHIFTYPDNENQKVIWILWPSPLHVVKTPDYIEFATNYLEHLEKQENLYKFDIKTSPEEQVKLINNIDFWDWLGDKYPDTYYDVLQYLIPSPEEVYNQNKCYKTEFLKTEILPKIPLEQIEHYYNFDRQTEC